MPPFLKYYCKKHFESFLAVYRMGYACGHYYAFTFVKHIYLAVNGKSAFALKYCHKGIAAWFMGAYFLVLFECKKSKAHSLILYKSSAYYLAVAVVYLFFSLSTSDLFIFLSFPFIIFAPFVFDLIISFPKTSVSCKYNEIILLLLLFFRIRRKIREYVF